MKIEKEEVVFNEIDEMIRFAQDAVRTPTCAKASKTLAR